DDMLALYCRKFVDEHHEFAVRVNRLIGEMIEACEYRVAFVYKLMSMTGVVVTTKTVEFLKVMMDKDSSREWQLCNLEKEARERAHEIKLFLQKQFHV
nr:hypothetical protein [Tanacetum cinerariifolium]